MSSLKLKFSGHETFHCRHFWLKKGFDFTMANGEFSNDNSVVGLGVGKNMVSSINFWLKAFAIKDVESNELTDFGKEIFTTNDGYDPFLEDNGTLWLLQSTLVKSNYSSIYNLVFSEFVKLRVNHEFTKEQLISFIKRKGLETGEVINETTVENDVKVFLKNYLLPTKNSKSIEDDFSALFIDLGILTEVPSNNSFRANYTKKSEIPKEIVLYIILDSFPEEVSISFSEIKELVSSCLLMNAEGLEEKLDEIIESYKGITFKEDAGRKELQLKKGLDKQTILRGYYEK